jgi:hypothetical protein
MPHRLAATDRTRSPKVKTPDSNDDATLDEALQAFDATQAGRIALCDHMVQRLQAPCSAGEADSRAALAHAYVVGDKFAAKIIEGVFFSVVFPRLFGVVHLFLAITPPAPIAP